jgi:hypothetical protein
VEGYRIPLLELGYSPLRVTRSLTATGHLGRWMQREELDVGQLNADAVKAFLAAHVMDRGRLPTAGVLPLLDYREPSVTSQWSRSPWRRSIG